MRFPITMRNLPTGISELFREAVQRQIQAKSDQKRVVSSVSHAGERSTRKVSTRLSR